MDVFTKENARLDYFRAQVVSSRNVNASLISDFYCGGLNYQIEHHLFPNLPRHRFGVVSQKVRAMCAKHGVKYVSVGFWEGFFDLFAVLARVGRQAAADFAGKSRSMMKGAKGVVKAKATKTM
jgi:fatty acid desaturase